MTAKLTFHYAYSNVSECKSSVESTLAVLSVRSSATLMSLARPCASSSYISYHTIERCFQFPDAKVHVLEFRGLL